MTALAATATIVLVFVAIVAESRYLDKWTWSASVLRGFLVTAFLVGIAYYLPRFLEFT